MEDLESFLKGEETAAVVDAPALVETPEPVEAETAAPIETTEPEAEPDVEGRTLVPLTALQAVRKTNQDWKERAIRAEEQAKAREAANADLARQLEEARKVPAPQAGQPAPATPSAPNPYEDPEGYERFQAQQARAMQNAEIAFTVRCDLTEVALKEKEGAEAVDAAVKTFGELVKANPALSSELSRQQNPYQWMWNKVQAAELTKQIGPDPVAYSAKLQAEAETAVRAKYEAKYGPLDDDATSAAFPATQQVRLPQSLGTARTAQSRSVPTFSGPPSLESLFPGS